MELRINRVRINRSRPVFTTLQSLGTVQDSKQCNVIRVHQHIAVELVSLRLSRFELSVPNEKLPSYVIVINKCESRFPYIRVEEFVKFDEFDTKLLAHTK